VIVQSRPGERLTFNILRDGRPLKVTLETARAELPDLGVALDPMPMSAPHKLPIVPEGSGGAEATLVSSVEGQPGKSSPRVDGVVDIPTTEARLRILERVVDSLMREIESLRSNPRP
jgi:hypothetical protein